MSRLESIVNQHAITVEVPSVWISEKKRATTSIRFTLSFETRALQGKHTTRNNTITPTEAISTFFSLANAARFDPNASEINAEYKKKIRTFLDQQYDVFQQTFLADQQENIDQLRTANNKSYQTREELTFVPGEHVLYLIHGIGHRESAWVYCIVIAGEVWQDGRFRGTLVQREKGGVEEVKHPKMLFKV